MQMGIVSARHVDHVGLVVPDLNAAIHFFGAHDSLGAQQNARTMDFHANDVGFVPAMAGHCIENIGEEDLVFLELFALPGLEEISLNNWLRSMPVQVAAAHTTFHRKRSS
jgi:oxalate decarboxylase/phosphoglucose isomerase-like protein (cupin superfamily)